MVTRIYTPYIQPYQRQGGPSPVDPEKRRNPNPWLRTEHTEHTDTPKDPPESTFTGPTGQTSSLGSVQEHLSSQPIQINTILDDFKNTMNALGVDESIRTEVNAYLHVVDLHTRKDKPEPAFIKQSLRTAANTLDKFISEALGQRSTVVKEWVDALLLQPVDFKNTQPLKYPETTPVPPPAGNPATAIEPPEAASSPASGALSPQEKRTLQSLVQQARQQFQTGNWAAGEERIQSGLSLLIDKNRPDLQGKLAHLAARAFDTAHKPAQALPYYQQASQLFEASGQTEKQAHALYAMASILDEQGQLDQAKTLYQQVIQLDEQRGQVTATPYNDLGSVYLRQGQAGAALPLFQQALQHAQADPALQLDIFSNLGATYRHQHQYEQSHQVYRQALQLAQHQQNRNAYQAILRQMAAMYVEADKPQLASKALARLQTFQRG